MNISLNENDLKYKDLFEGAFIIVRKWLLFYFDTKTDTEHVEYKTA